MGSEQHGPRLSGLQLVGEYFLETFIVSFYTVQYVYIILELCLSQEVQTLISKLLVCSGRLSAAEALRDYYFLLDEN